MSGPTEVGETSTRSQPLAYLLEVRNYIEKRFTLNLCVYQGWGPNRLMTSSTIAREAMWRKELSGTDDDIYQN